MERRPEFSTMQQSVVIPPALNRGVPRDVRLTGAGKILFAIAVAAMISAVAVGILLAAIGVRETDEDRQLSEHGVTSNATVVRVWRGSDKSKQPWVSYQFDAGGRTVEARSKMTLAAWGSLQAGSSLAVRYLPERPELSAPAGAPPRALPDWVPYLAAAPLALGGLACLFGIRMQRQLLANGRAAAAVVTKQFRVQSGEGGTHRSIAYEFPLLSGAVASGRASTSSNPPAVGTVICVVYDPERPKRNRPYPFALVRPA